ncbi:hypothetical protein TNCV_1181981 [Trichonephila clavipes]|nr:hypothetical protein TNCV_1181981 [Trichonephila clavipes]
MVLKGVPQLHGNGFGKSSLGQQDRRKKLLLTQKMRGKRLVWVEKYRAWTVNDWKKVILSGETFICTGIQIKRS